MSPRAAWRLESLGFENVYDYVPGKADWFAAGLPRAGTRAPLLRAKDVVREAAATCRLTDRIGEAAERARAAGQDACLVLTEGGVVLGRVRGRAFDADPATPVETVMEAGPTTVRPDEPLEAFVERLRGRDVASVIVTSSDGILLGMLHREDAERRLAGGAEEEQPSCVCLPAS